MEIKIINVNNELYGVQKTEFGEFHDYYERYLYIGYAQEGDVVTAELIYEAKYPTSQWARIIDDSASNKDRNIRRVYIDSNQ